MVTFAAAGEDGHKEDMLGGYQAIGRDYCQHFGGYGMNEQLSAESCESFEENIKTSARKEFFYVDDDGLIAAIRLGDRKGVSLENRAETSQIRREPVIELQIPLLSNLGRDPFEKVQHNSKTYYAWFIGQAASIHCSSTWYPLQRSEQPRGAGVQPNEEWLARKRTEACGSPSDPGSVTS